jgi:hypothetical protein
MGLKSQIIVGSTREWLEAGAHGVQGVRVQLDCFHIGFHGFALFNFRTRSSTVRTADMLRGSP